MWRKASYQPGECPVLEGDRPPSPDHPAVITCPLQSSGLAQITNS